VSPITTHVLDTARGRPVAGLHVALEWRAQDGSWQQVGRGVTDADGRLRTLVDRPSGLAPGVYRLLFDTKPYFESQGAPAFYPEVVVTFETVAGEAHYHVPLLLSPFGYSTYRGS
jgi:5-hydroxyisourate hydrolase